MRNRYLMHHGILGQKWGVRRFQDKNGRLTSAGKERYGKEGKEKEEPGDKDKFWTDERKAIAKKVAIGAAVVGGIALGSYVLYKSGALNSALKKSINAGKNTIQDYADIYLPKVDGEVVDSAKDNGNEFLNQAKEEGIKVLDSVPTGDDRTIDYIESRLATMNPSGTNINCPGVCAAYDLQARGLNVCAQNKIYTAQTMKEMYPKYELKPVKSFEDFKSIVEKLPEGSRGELSAEYREDAIQKWKNKGGKLDGIDTSKVSTFRHGYPWEIKDGKIILSNGQTDSHVYTDEELKYIVTKLLKSDNMFYEQLDNLEVDLEGVSIEMSSVQEVLKEI